MKNWILVFLGGGLGSLCRYLLGRGMVLLLGKSWFPTGTFLANILGCFLIGVILSALEKYDWLDGRWGLILATGFCGGFTTFSSFAYENNLLLQEMAYGSMLTYTMASLVLGLLATALGIYLFRL
ncbi:MAG: fluoride efflux transporter CrcB [Bacteroidota bacterium]